MNPYAAPTELTEPDQTTDGRNRLIREAIAFGAFVFVVLAVLDLIRGAYDPLWSDLAFGAMSAVVAWSLHRLWGRRVYVPLGVSQGAVSVIKKAAFSSGQGGT